MTERVRLILRMISYGEYMSVWDEIPLMMRPYYTLHRYDNWWWPIFHSNPSADKYLIAQTLKET